MLEAKTVRIGAKGAVMTVVASVALAFVWLAARWVWSTRAQLNLVGLVDPMLYLGAIWAGVSGLAESVSVPQIAVLAVLGFVLGIVLARRRAPQSPE